MRSKQKEPITSTVSNRSFSAQRLFRHRRDRDRGHLSECRLPGGPAAQVTVFAITLHILLRMKGSQNELFLEGH